MLLRVWVEDDGPETVRARVVVAEPDTGLPTTRVASGHDGVLALVADWLTSLQAQRVE